MIRSILVLIYLVLFLVIGCIPALIFQIIGIKNPGLKDRASYAYVKWGFSCICFLSGVKVTCEGRENIPDDKAVLYVANHRSFFDVVTGYIFTKGITGFVSKKEVGKVPLLSIWMKNIHCLFLDRKNMREGIKTILEGAKQVKDGKSVWIFPEGTRNRGEEGSVLEFKEGSFIIAERSRCLIIPVAIAHTADVLENHFPFIRKTQVSIRFGKPIDLSGLSKEEKKTAGADTRKVIEDMLSDMLRG